jgi:hypothetical protein
MRKLAGQVAIAVVLFAVGLACWRAGQLERRVADAHKQLALLKYDTLEATYDDIERSIGVAGRVPWLTDRLLTDVREQRGATRYWNAEFESFQPARDASGAVIEQEPRLLALVANATYRASPGAGGDRQATLRRLEAALKAYADLLKKQPGDVEAAYNYEFVARLRDTVSRSRPVPLSKRDERAGVNPGTFAATTTGDLPEGRTIHGDPGAPPPKTDMSQFKMHIPVRPDERQGGSEAGQGGKKVRKG